ncbi:MAG: hypothetical protein N3A38_14840 [Planctomycetota bacterium]|nr:hypothetical protein [Planctomycetota bacterium]
MTVHRVFSDSRLCGLAAYPAPDGLASKRRRIPRWPLPVWAAAFGPARPLQVLAWMAAVVCLASAAAHSAACAADLQDSGGRGVVRVKVHLPFGPYFRQGRLFPVTVDVESADRIPRGEVLFEEGTSPRVKTWRLPGVRTFHGSDRFYCSARGGRLELVLKGAMRGSEGVEIFRAPLSACVRPLAPDERLVAVIFGDMRPARLPPAGNIGRGLAARVVTVRAADLPCRAAEYGTVDLAVVEDDCLSGLSPARMEAITLWVMGGGRLMACGLAAIRSAAATLLSPAAGGTTDGAGKDGPVPPARGEEAPAGGWEAFKNTWGLSDGDVIEWADVDRTRPSVVAFRRGLGECVFFFAPPSDRSGNFTAAARREYVRLLSFPDPPADARARWDAFRVFDYGHVPASLTMRGTSGIALPCLTILAGACILFRFLRPFRGRIWAEAAAVLAASSLLAAAVARLFPEPGVSSASVAVRIWPADGCGRAETSLTLLRSFRGHRGLRIESAPGGEAIPLAERHEELAAQRYTVLASEPAAIEGMEVPADAPQVIWQRRFVRLPGPRRGASGGDRSAAIPPDVADGAAGWLYVSGDGKRHIGRGPLAAPGAGPAGIPPWEPEPIRDIRTALPGVRPGMVAFHEALAWAISQAPASPCLVVYRSSVEEPIRCAGEDSATHPGWRFDIVVLPHEWTTLGAKRQTAPDP